jgi:hypothetical protein
MYQKYFAKLASEEHKFLEKLVSSGSAPARKLQRAKIMLQLDCSEGFPNCSFRAICDAFYVNPMTVTNILKDFAERGLKKTINRKKPEREYQHSLDGHAEAHLIAIDSGIPLDYYERRSLRLLHDLFKLKIVRSISYETIRTSLKKMKLNLG